MSIARLSSHAAQMLLDVANRKEVEANPFIMEDGVPKVKFDGLTVEQLGRELVLSFLWQGKCIFIMREPYELALGDKLNIRGLLGSMGLELH